MHGMAKILITGSEGLIGKTLREKLSATSYLPKRFDNSLPNTTVDYGDIRHLDSINKHISDCDGIIHLAAISRVEWGQYNPEHCLQTNVFGTLNLLEAAKTSLHKPWVIYASSREVYGYQEQFPVTESANLNPLNVYARSKAAAESLVKSYQKYGLNTAILRFSNVYGRTDDHSDRVIPAFCQAVIKKEPMRIDGLNNAFDFTHVSDVCDGILQVIKALAAGEQLPTMHFTTGQATSLKELAEIACAAYGLSPLYSIAPPRNFDMAKFYGCSKLAEETIGWHPKIDLVTGIRKLTAAYSKILQPC
jgi:UDP-glucose 4-epimerase